MIRCAEQVCVRPLKVREMNNSKLLAFIVASSLPVTVWPLAGLGIAAQRSGADFDFAIAAIVIPLLFGSFHALSTAIGLPGSRKAYFLVGALLGLVMASIGTFIAHIPETVYGLTDNRKYLALIGGPLFYAAVWGIVLWPLQQMIINVMQKNDDS